MKIFGLIVRMGAGRNPPGSNYTRKKGGIWSFNFRNDVSDDIPRKELEFAV